MERHEALAIALQLLEDPTLGQYDDGRGGSRVWTDSALGTVTDFLRGTLAPDGSEEPDSLARGLAGAQKLADWGLEPNLARQVRAIVRTLLAYQEQPLRLKRPELSGITRMTDLHMVFCYLRRLWKVKREAAPPAAPAPRPPAPRPARPPRVAEPEALPEWKQKLLQYEQQRNRR